MRIAAPLLLAALLALAQNEPAGARKLDKVCTPEDQDALGLTCSDSEPCPVFLELASAESNGASLFVAGDLHTQNTTMFGLLLQSDDQGASWTEPVGRMRSAALEQIQFVDAQHGWVSGVKLEPLPRDPFLLATTDGGKTWTQSPLFDDAAFGSIQQFWFDSATDGELVLDKSQGAANRYERYATKTGAASWELQEAGNKPIRLPQANPRENPDWRVRAGDGAYLVERRSNDGSWRTAARFEIRAGECK
ncbi:MAG TPA: hypothetical protein VKV74_02960 [Bryobacteraceae bacterium]|nr:hypothetical protein [Bryobacteraceae bacterium]